MKALENRFVLLAIAVIGIYSAVTLANENIKAKPKEEELMLNIKVAASLEKGTCKRRINVCMYLP